MTDESVEDSMMDTEAADQAPEQGDNGDEGPSAAAQAIAAMGLTKMSLQEL